MGTELKLLIKEVFENKDGRKKTKKLMGEDLAAGEILRENLHSLNKVAIAKLSKLGHTIPNISSLVQVSSDAEQFFKEDDIDQKKKMQMLVAANQVIGKLP